MTIPLEKFTTHAQFQFPLEVLDKIGLKGDELFDIVIVKDSILFLGSADTMKYIKVED